MNSKRKANKSKDGEDEFAEKLNAQNKALKKILKKLSKRNNKNL